MGVYYFITREHGRRDSGKVEYGKHTKYEPKPIYEEYEYTREIYAVFCDECTSWDIKHLNPVTLFSFSWRVFFLNIILLNLLFVLLSLMCRLAFLNPLQETDDFQYLNVIIVFLIFSFILLVIIYRKTKPSETSTMFKFRCRECGNTFAYRNQLSNLSKGRQDSSQLEGFFAQTAVTVISGNDVYSITPRNTQFAQAE